MSIQMIAILGLDNALITQGFETSDRLLKIWLDLITNSTKSKVIDVIVQ